MRCEVCESIRPGAKYGERYKVREVRFDARAVHLCGAHEKIAKHAGVTSFAELRELYGDDRQRSYVPRREPSRTGGRRSTDRA